MWQEHTLFSLVRTHTRVHTHVPGPRRWEEVSQVGLPGTPLPGRSSQREDPQMLKMPALQQWPESTEVGCPQPSYPIGPPPTPYLHTNSTQMRPKQFQVHFLFTDLDLLGVLGW